jgi:hypothetical protein
MTIRQDHTIIGIIFDVLRGWLLIAKEQFDKTMKLLHIESTTRYSNLMGRVDGAHLRSCGEGTCRLQRRCAHSGWTRRRRECGSGSSRCRWRWRQRADIWLRWLRCAMRCGRRGPATLRSTSASSCFGCGPAAKRWPLVPLAGPSQSIRKRPDEPQSGVGTPSMTSVRPRKIGTDCVTICVLCFVHFIL